MKMEGESLWGSYFCFEVSLFVSLAHRAIVPSSISFLSVVHAISPRLDIPPIIETCVLG